MGVRLAVYAVAGTVAGIIGFGLIWAGFSRREWVAVPFGFVLLLAGLNHAGTALAASMLARRAGERAGSSPAPPRPAPAGVAAADGKRPDA